MASQYGWTKKYIDTSIYFDDLYYLTEQANKRRINDWKMQLAITQNPHTKEPQKLWQEFDRLDNKNIINNELDREGMQLLKKIMSNGKWIKVR